LKRYEEALGAADQALVIGQSADAWKSKGRALAALKRYQEALEAYERVQALEGEQRWVLSNQSATLLRLKRYEEALTACERAIALDPDNRNAWLCQVVALRKLKHSRLAWRAALRIPPRRKWEDV
jgi:tetratricopeptide (TPR) repeat protein